MKRLQGIYKAETDAKSVVIVPIPKTLCSGDAGGRGGDELRH